MKNPDPRLLEDLFPSPAPEDTLRRAAPLLRRRRLRQRLLRLAPLPLLAAAAALALVFRPPAPPPIPTPSPAPTPSEFAQPPPLTDEELFALFPGVPKALVRVGNEERLVFTRPEHIALYVGRAGPTGPR